MKLIILPTDPSLRLGLFFLLWVRVALNRAFVCVVCVFFFLLD